MKGAEDMEARDYKVDNIRFLLIFCVVFGHLLELFSGPHTDFLYRLIYSFHMPAFIFLTGYFAKHDPKKILFSLIYPYFLFQTLYLLFKGYVIDGADTVAFSYTTPYWLLWYLLVTVFYYLLIPLIQWDGTGAQLAVLILAVAVSLLAGAESGIGYFLSLSRFFCFLPFFVAGFYCGHRPRLLRKTVKKRSKVLLLLCCIVVLFIAEYLVLRYDTLFTRNVLYGSYSYAATGTAWKQRAILLVTAFAWIGALFLIVPGKKLPVISVIGKHTFPIFLFHGFIIRLLQKFAVFKYTEAGNLGLAFGFTLVILLLLGNPFSAWVCKWGFTGQWINALAGRKKKAKSFETV